MSFPITTPAGTFTVTDDDYAVVNGIPTATPKWFCPDVDQLWLPGSKRGTDPDTVPNTDGQIPNPLWLTGMDVTLTIVLLEAPREDLRTTLGLMREWWGQIPDTPDSTADLEFHWGGDIYETPAQMTDFRWPPSVAAGSMALLRLFIGAGQLIEGGS